MAPHRAPRVRRRLRAGSLERPVNARSYRGTWLLVGVPLLLVAFSVPAVPALPRLPGYVSAFDADAATATARTIAQRFPDRRPGTRGAARATDYVQQHFEASGFHVTRDAFEEDVAGLGTRTLVNLVAEAPGRSRDTIVVIAHRDDSGPGGGLDDNASGTAALLELARGYGARAAAARTPLHTIVFLSTDGGAYGGLGAKRFAERALGHRVILGAIALDAIAGRGPVRIVTASDSPSSPDPTLVGTARDALGAASSRLEVTHASASHQLLDLAFPFSLYEQAPFTARGTPAIALTTAADRPPDTPTGGRALDEPPPRAARTAARRRPAARPADRGRAARRAAAARRRNGRRPARRHARRDGADRDDDAHVH